MYKEFLEQFVGKTIASIKAVPFSPDKAHPFSVLIDFTDGARLNVEGFTGGGSIPDETGKGPYKSCFRFGDIMIASRAD